MGEISSYSPSNVGQQGLKEGSGLGPKVSSWNQCCCVQTANPSPCRAATEHFAPSKSAHKQPCNGAELQDSFLVSFSGQCHVIARIHCVIAQKVYNALCAFRDCVYILFWIIDNASLKVLSGISCWNLWFRNTVILCSGIVGVQSGCLCQQNWSYLSIKSGLNEVHLQ